MDDAKKQLNINAEEHSTGQNGITVDVSSPAVSGDFLRISGTNAITTVSSLILEFDRISRDLAATEQKLISCNNPVELAEFARHVQRHKKDFTKELPKLVRNLEATKRDLTLRLQEVKERMLKENPSFVASLGSNRSASLINRMPRATPNRESGPGIALRNVIIARHLEKPNMAICRLLDAEYPPDRAPVGFFPQRWSETFGVKTFVEAYMNRLCRKRLHKLIAICRDARGYRKP